MQDNPSVLRYIYIYIYILSNEVVYLVIFGDKRNMAILKESEILLIRRKSVPLISYQISKPPLPAITVLK